ncbi:MAG TPA: hypothetical protein VGP64_11875 [Polyangia bacterium]|jgi:hypothetical protein
MKGLATVALAVLVGAAAPAWAGPAATAQVAASEPSPVEQISATGYGYVVPDAPNYLMGIASADLAWLHVEGRYNYEALRTGSAFGGLNFGWGRPLRLNLTPMVGGVFGRLDGIAPALRFTITWWRVDLFSESEVVVPFASGSRAFFYDWSELGLSLPLGIRAGGAIQRNLVFQTALEVQRGLFAGLRLGPFNFTVYEFNWGWISPTFVFALGLGV